MTERRPARPQILVAVCLYLGGLFAIQFVTNLILVVGLASPDGQESAKRQIGWFEGGGTSFAEATSIYRVILTALVVIAAAGVVFAVHAARGHHPSRVLLTVVAGVFLVAGVTGVAGDGYLAVIVGFVSVIFAAQLWSPVVRSYFREVAGKAPLPAPAVGSSTDPFAARHGVDSGSQQSAAPPEPPTTYAPPVQDWPPVPYQHPGYPPPAYAYAPAKPPADQRPRAVNIAVWTALIGSLVVAALSSLMLLGVLLTDLDYQSVIAEGGPGADMVRGSQDEFETALRHIVVLSSVSIPLAVGGVVASALVLLRPRSGGVMLFVMTVVTLIFSGLGFPLGLPWTAAAIVALVQLRKPEARAWFART
ncbi:MAG: hypothetical protein JWP31_66 [Aeromicrobium sp.]|nr:hypothetical protein [Aeromicrobium sp.]